jgi:ketosteroid isomerase-like protein
VSRENVGVVRRNLEAWQRDDFDSWLTGFDTTVEWHTVLERAVEGPDSCYRGHEGLHRLWRDYRTEQGFQIGAVELRDAGDDRVVLLGQISVRGLTSGIESESQIGMVITVRNGKVVHSVDFLSHAEALQVVGLEE